MPVFTVGLRPEITVIQQLGLSIALNGRYTTGQHVDGTYYVVADGSGNVVFNSVALTADVTSNKYVGGVMVDPGRIDITTQGFDNRLNAGGRGPGVTYDAGSAETLPLTVNVSTTTAKTVCFYRGVDASSIGGGETSGCYARVDITVYPSSPGANPIKPTSLYVAGGKPCYTRSNINFNLYTPVAIPAAAVANEPNWDTLKGYHKWPLSIQGTTVNAGFITPTGTQYEYNNGSQGALTGELLLGAISDSASRQTLIERIVRDGLHVHSAIALGSTAHIANGGFGVGRKILRYLAGKYLGVSAMLNIPSTILYPGPGVNVAYFHEDGSIFAGSTRALYGTLNSGLYPTPPYHDNHDVRDSGGTREPHWVVYRSGTAQAGGNNTITLAAGTADGIIATDRIYITGGTGSGQLGIITNWDNTTKVVTVQDNWSTNPNATSTYEVYNGGSYQADVTRGGMIQTAMALKLIGENDDTTVWADEFFEYCQRWYDDDGYLTPRYPTTSGWIAQSSQARRFLAVNSGDWTPDWWSTAAPLWTA